MTCGAYLGRRCCAIRCAKPELLFMIPFTLPFPHPLPSQGPEFTYWWARIADCTHKWAELLQVCCHTCKHLSVFFALPSNNEPSQT